MAGGTGGSGMQAEPEGDREGVRNVVAWEQVVAEAVPCDHIVQLYQEQDFMSYAVGRFALAGLAKGEGVILVSTDPHWTAIRPRLEAEGVDVRSAQTRGQLTVVDANELLPRFMKGDPKSTRLNSSHQIISY